MIDTHCHLGDDYKEVLQRAFSKGVHHVINICIHPSDIERGQKIVKEFPSAPMVAGIHPCHAHEVEANHFEQIVRLAEEKKIVAIGETGLDLHHSKDHLEIQKEFFKKHIELANDLDLALSIHCRNAYNELKEFVEKHPIKKGILHCFAGPKEIATWALDAGFTLSFQWCCDIQKCDRNANDRLHNPPTSVACRDRRPLACPRAFSRKNK